MTVSLDARRVAPARGDKAGALVVLLHGFGSNGDDLIQLAPHLSPYLPDAAFVAPDAPSPVMMPGAPANARQWFAIERLDPAEMEAGVRAAAPVVDAFIDAELDRHGLSGDRLALVGFSQGCMLALHVGLRRAVAPFAVVGLSGALCGAEALEREVTARPPILLIHGDQDPVVPPQLMLESARALSAAGLGVRWKLDEGVAHSIGPQGLALAQEFLARAARGTESPFAPRPDAL